MQSKGLVRLARPSNEWYQLYCPFHNNGNERKPSCGCSLTEQYRGGKEFSIGFFHCFSCGAAYSFSQGIKKILEMHGTSVAAHPLLEKYVTDVTVDPSSSLIPGEVINSVMTKYAVDDLRMRAKLKHDFVTEEELAKYRFTVPYMYQRRLTDPVIEKYDVGFDANHIPPGRKKALPCITFPIRDLQGRTISICRRSVEGKYFNMPTGIEKPVYGIYELPKGTKEIIVCESIFNALTCTVYGYPAVALLGTGSSTQINQLKKLGVSVFNICLDNDDAGNRGAEKLKNALCKNAIVWTLHVPEGKDVNELEKYEFDAVYRNRD